jgi:hypothetical protein
MLYTTVAARSTLYSAFGSKNNAVRANNRNTSPPINVTEKEREKIELMLVKPRQQD